MCFSRGRYERAALGGLEGLESRSERASVKAARQFDDGGTAEKKKTKTKLTFALLPRSEDLFQLPRARRELHEPHRRRVGRGQDQNGPPLSREGVGAARGADRDEQIGRVPPGDLFPLRGLRGVVPDRGVGRRARDPLLLLGQGGAAALVSPLAGNELVLFLLEVDVGTAHAPRPEDASPGGQQGPGPSHAKEHVGDPGSDVARVERIELELA